MDALRIPQRVELSHGSFNKRFTELFPEDRYAMVRTTLAVDRRDRRDPVGSHAGSEFGDVGSPILPLRLALLSRECDAAHCHAASIEKWYLK